MSVYLISQIRLLPVCITAIAGLCMSSVTNANEPNSIQSQRITNQETDRFSYEQTNSIASARSKKPKIFVVEQSLPDFLRHAARRNGYEITITPRVRGTLKKMSLPLNMEEMLKKIAPQFDLKWHFQQKQLYVSVGSENTTRMIFLGNTDMEDLKKAIQGAGFKSQAYNLTFVEDSNSVIVNGPISYIASVELIAEALIKNKANKREKLKIIRFGNINKN